VIHVISGPSDRIEYGIQLYQEGYGERLYLTGRGRQAGEYKRKAVRLGVPAEAVVADGAWVTSTYSEALRLQTYIAQSEVPVRSVIVCSDAYHTRRARWAYRRVLGSQVQLQMAPVPFDQSPLQREWWVHPLSRERVAEEYAKLVYYFARYQLFHGPIRAWLVSLDTS
jgi:uncharacterized SAM-binding protein YcdF (DUF218 family)